MSTKPLPSTIWKNPIQFITTGFGLGSLPYAPGTWGTIAAVPIYFLLHDLSLLNYSLFLILTFALGVYLCDHCQKIFEVPDHPGIVWDEMVGFWVTMFAVPFSWTWILLGFALFRLFDIWKPWPVSYCETQIKHAGLSIMLDDVLAAVYAWGVLQLIILISGYFQ